MGRSSNCVTCTISREFYTGYRCSKCGGCNVFLHKVKVDGCAETNDDYVSAGTSLHLENLARIQAKKLMQAKVEVILQEQKKGVYRTAEYNHKCSFCGHKELWSKLCLRRWNIYAPIIAYCAFPGVLLAFSIEVYVGLAALAAAAAVFGVPFIVHWILRHLRERKIAELPQNAKPMLTLDPNEPTFRSLFGQ